MDVDGRRLFQMKRTIRLFIEYNPGVETSSCLARKKLCRVLYHPAPVRHQVPYDPTLCHEAGILKAVFCE